MNHAGLTLERWSRFTLPQQILQIAAEMHRARSAFASGDRAHLVNSYERALRLLDLTAAGEIRSALRKELLNWRDFVAGLHASDVMDVGAHELALRALLHSNRETYEHAEALGV